MFCTTAARVSPRHAERAVRFGAAVKSLGHARFGTAILFVAATGFAAYRLYRFALPRYSRR